MGSVLKDRLDKRVSDLFPAFSRSYIQSIILQGKVFVDGVVVNKPGTQVKHDVVIAVHDEQPKYVSRGGFKLEHALDTFHIDVTERVALDAGISTGGFTDCLLQRGVAKVYGVDVGVGQVHEKIQHNERVTLLEKTNVRYLKSLPQLVDMVTLDLSFISLLKVMPAVINCMKHDAFIIALIKPQFEAERHQIARGGIVKDGQVHEQVIAKVTQGMREYGLHCKGVIESSLLGATGGNKEFLALFSRRC
jgi:23S rRNA (cytidine1920-2'-O)/16S rRNA (cytidine1409-2'-O)-methyltransferase